MSDRVQQVNSLIRTELSKILVREVDFSKNILVTITQVQTSSNIIQANVYISVIPEEQTDKVLQVLNKIIYSIQQNLNKRLRMRPVPKIRFLKDNRTSEAAKVEELLEEIKDEDRSD
ncbi:MAG: 30S ribosome-binding factor RbfA [Patescibacteria group bacterium]|nr:30S ribosome-binding factor RbfA [Patescibacteria group bacterium]